MTDTKDKAMPTDAMIEAFVKASDSNDLGVEKGSFLWEATERGLIAALALTTPPAAQAEEEIEAAARRMWESEPVIYAWGPQERHHVSWKEAIERDLAGVGIFRQFARAALRSAQPPARTYADGIEDAAKCAEMFASTSPAMPEYDNGYGNARRDAAKAIRALSTKPAGKEP